MTDAGTNQPGFGGLRVVAFENRFAQAMRELILRHGGEPTVAPALREIPLEENRDALAFADRLFAGECDVLILLTGVGTRTLAAAVATRHPPPQLAQALTRTTVIVRGPKPAQALREMGVTTFLTVPEPNTWRELLTVLDTHGPVKGRRVFVQEYGASNLELLQALRDRGAAVTQVPVYRWAMPDDPGPLQAAVRSIANGDQDVALFTNAIQVEHVARVALSMTLPEPVEFACDGYLFHAFAWMGQIHVMSEKSLPSEKRV